MDPPMLPRDSSNPFNKGRVGGAGIRAENMNRCIWEKANSKVKSIFHNTKMQDINRDGGVRGEEYGEEKGM